MRLRIPKIGVDAAIEAVGVTPDYAMDVPERPEDAGWFAPGYVPGEPGNAVIDGHLDWYTGPAVFIRLRELVVGDEIVVVRADGQELRFVVTQLVTLDAHASPAAIFAPATAPHLNLITCEGVFDRAAQAYAERLVVFSQLSPS